MALVQYRKLWQTEEKVRYVVMPVPEERYGVEFHLVNNTVAPSEQKATALANALLRAIIRLHPAQPLTLREMPGWPESGDFRL